MPNNFKNNLRRKTGQRVSLTTREPAQTEAAHATSGGTLSLSPAANPAMDYGYVCIECEGPAPGTGLCENCKTWGELFMAVIDNPFNSDARFQLDCFLDSLGGTDEKKICPGE